MINEILVTCDELSSSLNDCIISSIVFLVKQWLL